MRRPSLARLVIFDCDGVLVDSERIAVRIDVQVLARLGCSLTETEVIERFVGRTQEFMTSEIEVCRKPFPVSSTARLRSRLIVHHEDRVPAAFRDAGASPS